MVHLEILFPYNLTVPSLRAAYAAPTAPVEVAGLEIRYANLNGGVALERSPLCRLQTSKKIGEDHKQRVAGVGGGQEVRGADSGGEEGGGP